jgi:hypothetical protein
MFVVWLSALLFVGAADVLKEQQRRNRVVAVDEQVHADGSSTATLIYGERRYYFLGPVPIGRWPIAVLSGVAFAASIMVWALCRRGKERDR